MNLTHLLLLATETISPGDIGMEGQVTDGNQIFSNALNAAYLWAGIICVVIIIIAGYFYVISNGNAATVKRAKDALTGAIIGLVVVILAFTITQFVIGRF
jgi:uncharacterized membrane protein YagU involved in acid resistance